MALNQGASAKIDLGLSPEMLHQTNTSIADLLMEGFSLQARTQITKDVKGIINDVLEHNFIKMNHKISNLMPMLIGFMFQIGVDVDIQFDDDEALDEIKENPLLQKFNLTMEQIALLLSKKTDDESLEDISKRVLTLQGLKTHGENQLVVMLVRAFKVLEDILEHVDDKNSITIKAGVLEFCIAAELSLSAKNLCRASPMLSRIFAYPFFNDELSGFDTISGMKHKTTLKKK